MDLTDAQWAVLEPRFRPKRWDDRRGRPWQDTRAVLNGVSSLLRTGAPWHDLPLVILPTKPAIAASSSGSAPGCSPHCCRNWRKTYAVEESWI